MICLNKEFEEESILIGYKKLLAKVLSEDLYKEGTSCGGLSADYIGEMIKHILYIEKCNKVDFSVSVEEDGYHLNVTINKKEK